MRVLLAAVNREHVPYPVAPLGALCVAAAARRAGHEVEFLDLGYARSPVRALRAALAAGRFDAAAFSIRNLDNCAYFTSRSYVDEVRELAECVRAGFGGPLILGGSGFSVAPGGWMRRLGADYGVVGEGEQAFVELLAGLEAKESGTVHALRLGQSPIPGVIVNPQSLDCLPSPAHELCRYKKYLARGGTVSIQTKRGCPFGCIYCIYPQLEGRGYRLRPAAAVADEIAGVIRECGARDFFFVDSVFNDPREHALAVCAELTRRRLPARWMAFCNPVGLDGELARAMAAAGCVGIEFGLDAATPKMLAALRKPFTQSQIREALGAVAGAGLPCAAHLLAGGPGETWADLEEAQRFLNDCAPVNAVFVSFGLRIYEGTPLEALARREGALAADADLFEPAFYVSPAMAEDAAARLDAIVRRRPEWSSPIDWRRPMMRWIQGLMNRLGVRPQWKNVRNYGKHLRR